MNPANLYISFYPDVKLSFGEGICIISRKKFRANISYTNQWIPILLNYLQKPVNLSKLTETIAAKYSRDFEQLISHLSESEFLYKFEAATEQLAYYSHENLYRGSISNPKIINTKAMDPIEFEMQNFPKLGILNYLKMRYSCSTEIYREIDLSTIAYLAYASYGVYTSNSEEEKRTTPSAGGLYPLELYYIAKEREVLTSYKYRHSKNSFQNISSSNGCIMELCNNQVTTKGAKGLMVYIYDTHKNFMKYREKGFYFALLEAGHAAQNITLAAQDKGVGTRCIGSIHIELVKSLLQIQNHKLPIYAVAIF